MDKMKAYKLQEEGLDTVDANLHLGHQADERDYGVGAQILKHIGITKMRPDDKQSDQACRPGSLWFNNCGKRSYRSHSEQI